MATVLSSWKEIAAYLGKALRTVQRYEDCFGLPVRRPYPESRVVFAIPVELDAWLKQQGTKQQGPNKKDHLGSGMAHRLKRDVLLEQMRTQITRLDANNQRLNSQMGSLRDRISAMALKNGRSFRQAA